MDVIILLHFSWHFLIQHFFLFVIRVAIHFGSISRTKYLSFRLIDEIIGASHVKFTSNFQLP